VFRADAGHIHHRLLRLGLSPRQALFMLWAVCAVCGAMAALLSALPHDAAAPLALLLALILFGAGVWVRVLDRGADGGTGGRRGGIVMRRRVPSRACPALWA